MPNLKIYKAQPNILWQGIRQINDCDKKPNFLIIGTNPTDNTGYLTRGELVDEWNKVYTVKITDATNTSPYGVAETVIGGNDAVMVVGSYNYLYNTNYNTGFIYIGKYDSLHNININNAIFVPKQDKKINTKYTLAERLDIKNKIVNNDTWDYKIEKSYNPNYTTISLSLGKYTFVHAIDRDVAVGTYNYYDASGNSVQNSFIYTISSNSVINLLDVMPTIAVYGIVYNKNTNTYTLCGGYSTNLTNNFDNTSLPVGIAFLCDYSPTAKQVTNLTKFNYDNKYGTTFTHFKGISHGDDDFTYYCAADHISQKGPKQVRGSFVKINRLPDGKFDPVAEWTDMVNCDKFISANGVASNNIVGVKDTQNTIKSYQVTVCL